MTGKKLALWAAGLALPALLAGQNSPPQTQAAPPDFSGVYYPLRRLDEREAEERADPHQLPEEDHRRGPQRRRRCPMVRGDARRMLLRSLRNTWRSGR